VRLLVGHNHIHIIGAAQAVVGNTQQAVRIRRKINADNVSALVGHYIQKPRVLMGEAIVILPPHQGCNQQVERRDGSAPRKLLFACLEPFGMLIEHGVDDMHKGFVA
jgi:hypothetical protein